MMWVVIAVLLGSGSCQDGNRGREQGTDMQSSDGAAGGTESSTGTDSTGVPNGGRSDSVGNGSGAGAAGGGNSSTTGGENVGSGNGGRKPGADSSHNKNNRKDKNNQIQ